MRSEGRPAFSPAVSGKRGPGRRLQLRLPPAGAQTARHGRFLVAGHALFDVNQGLLIICCIGKLSGQDGPRSNHNQEQGADCSRQAGGNPPTSFSHSVSGLLHDSQRNGIRVYPRHPFAHIPQLRLQAISPGLLSAPHLGRTLLLLHHAPVPDQREPAGQGRVDAQSCAGPPGDFLPHHGVLQAA